MARPDFPHCKIHSSHDGHFGGGINGRYRSTECPRHRHFQPWSLWLGGGGGLLRWGTAILILPSGGFSWSHSVPCVLPDTLGFELHNGHVLGQGSGLGHEGLGGILCPLAFTVLHRVVPHAPCTVHRASNALVQAALGVGSVRFGSFAGALDGGYDRGPDQWRAAGRSRRTLWAVLP